MRKTFIAFIFIIFTAPHTEAAIVVNHTLTEDPKQGSACEIPVAKYSFTFSDEIYSWILVEQGHSSDTVGFVWYDPQGGAQCSYYTGFNYEGRGCYWQLLCSMDPSTFESMQGVWHVDSYYNYVKQSTANFLLTLAGTPCPLELLYGENSERTALLRDFRDSILLQTPAGREIINLYYQWSPAVVTAMEKDEEFKAQVKAIVDVIVELMGGASE